MKTKINKISSEWVNIKNKCRTTVGKNYTENTPSEKFKQDILISEHSPIRLLSVDWSWEEIKSWVAVHFSRHKWECFVSTQRTDRTGINRDNLSQKELVKFDGVANAQNLIDTARKRLCFQASVETRIHMEDLKKALHPMERQLSECLVPNCVYRGGCPEFPETNKCRYWDNFTKRHTEINLLDIRERYQAYNNDFMKENTIE